MSTPPKPFANAKRAARVASDHPLSQADKIAAFKACTGALVRDFPEKIARGMTDDELATVLQRVLGIMGGGSSRKNCPAFAYAGAGLKIWASWGLLPDMQTPPLFCGAVTIRMAREIYRITDPSERQLAMF